MAESAAQIPTETRILRLEERLAWFEKHVVEQDRVMLELGEQLVRLKAELRQVREKGEGNDASGAEAVESPPPHY